MSESAKTGKPIILPVRKPKQNVDNGASVPAQAIIIPAANNIDSYTDGAYSNPIAHTGIVATGKKIVLPTRKVKDKNVTVAVDDSSSESSIAIRTAISTPSPSSLAGVIQSSMSHDINNNNSENISTTDDEHPQTATITVGKAIQLPTKKPKPTRTITADNSDSSVIVISANSNSNSSAKMTATVTHAAATAAAAIADDRTPQSYSPIHEVRSVMLLCLVMFYMGLSSNISFRIQNRFEMSQLTRSSSSSSHCSTHLFSSHPNPPPLPLAWWRCPPPRPPPWPPSPSPLSHKGSTSAPTGSSSPSYVTSSSSGCSYTSDRLLSPLSR